MMRLYSAACRRPPQVLSDWSVGLDAHRISTRSLLARPLLARPRGQLLESFAAGQNYHSGCRRLSLWAFACGFASLGESIMFAREYVGFLYAAHMPVHARTSYGATVLTTWGHMGRMDLYTVIAIESDGCEA